MGGMLMGAQMSYATLRAMWQDFGDCPVNDYGEIDDAWCGWGRLTDLEEIWHWFDEQYAAHGGVHALMFPDEHARNGRRGQREPLCGVADTPAGRKPDNGYCGREIARETAES